MPDRMRPTGSDSVARSDGGSGRFLSRQEATSTYGQIPARFKTPLRPTVTTFGQQLAGIDYANNQMLFVSSTGPSLLTTADYGTTFSANRTLPAGVIWYDCKKIVNFKGKVYLLTLSSAVGAIWSATPDYTPGATWTWTQVHTTAATDNLPTCLSTDGTYLYVGEYGDPVGGPSLYRSSDGTTWTRVVGPLAGNRHCHAIEPDPYNPGHVWATWGDGGDRYVTRSTDYGATWSTIVTGSATVYGTWGQVVQISFAPDRVWFASDDPSGSVYTIDRAELFPRFATVNRHIDLPVPGAVPRSAGSWFADGVHTNNSKTLTSATATFSSTDVGRQIFSPRLPGGDVFIASVQSSTSVTLSVAATSSGTSSIQLAGSRWPNVAYFGAVDPATGIYYLGCWDAALMDDPTRGSIMYVPQWGQRIEIFQTLPATNGITRWQVFIYGGYVWSARWRLPLATR